MSAQQSVSPHKQQPIKHSPKSTEKTKASPNKKVSVPELFGIPTAGTSKSKIDQPFFSTLSDIDQQIGHSKAIKLTKNHKHNSSHPYSKLLEQKVNQDSDNGKHTPKISNKTQQQTEKNGAKKTQAQSKGTGNSKAQVQTPNQGGNSNGNGSAASGPQSKQKSCFNQFCQRDKNISSGSSPQQESTRKQGGNGAYKQAKLEKTGEKVTFCDLCCSRYQDKHFCYYCQQVYFDEYNIDDREWIQCDSCDRWCHLHCEDEKTKKAFTNSQLENVQYDCPRCRCKDNNTSSSSSTQAVAATQASASSKQLQASTKATKEKPSSAQAAGGTKMKKQGKNKEKDEKKQDQAESQIDTHMNGHTNGQSNTLTVQNYNHPSFYSVQQSRMDSVTMNSLKKGNTGVSSSNRDSLTQNGQNEQDIYYSFDNFKRKKNKIFQNKNLSLMYQPVQPLILLPNYTTIDDLLKSAGISVSLDEGSIKSDLNDLKRILMDTSDSSFKSTSSNQLPNGIHNLQNGQTYSIVVNQE